MSPAPRPRTGGLDPLAVRETEAGGGPEFLPRDPDEHPRLCLTYSLHGAVGQVEVSSRERGVRVFPNPTNGMLTVQVPPDESITTIQLIGGMGEVGYEWREQALERLMLELPAVAPGRYLIRIVGLEKVWSSPVILNRP